MTHPRCYQIGLPRNPATPGEEIISQPFSWVSLTPFKLFTIPNTMRILTCEIVIEDVFDDVDSLLTVGTLAEPDKYMKSDQNEPYSLGEYETSLYYQLLADTDVYITIDKKTSTKGSGVVVVYYDEPYPP